MIVLTSEHQTNPILFMPPKKKKTAPTVSLKPVVKDPPGETEIRDLETTKPVPRIEHTERVTVAVGPSNRTIVVTVNYADPDPLPKSEEIASISEEQVRLKTLETNVIHYVATYKGKTTPEIRTALHQKGLQFNKKELNKVLKQNCKHQEDKMAGRTYKYWYSK
jgi:predicted GTPase